MTLTDEKKTKSQQQPDEKDLKTVVVDELHKKGSSGPWLWKLFFLCITPNILNGFHVNSYVFFGRMPDAHWCSVPELVENGWTTEQIRNFTTRDGISNQFSCQVKDWNYTRFVGMDYDTAKLHTEELAKPFEVPCKENSPKNHYVYDQETDVSIVPEWDLVCENQVWRSNAQVALSIGKFLAASSFGVISDRFGRKKAFMVGCLIYLTSGIATVVSPYYWIFLLGRVGIGAASSALFYPAFTMLTENISLKHRSWMSVVYTISYPIGMLILAMCANFLHPWRHLQAALVTPGLLLVIHCYFMDESPRWLISKNREEQAYKILFGTEPDMKLLKKSAPKIEESVDTTGKKSIKEKLKHSLSEFVALFATGQLRKQILICYFIWCITSMTYYVTALNAPNFTTSKILYVAYTGLVDIPSYFFPVLMLRYLGRKISGSSLLAFTGTFLLLVLATDNEDIKVIFAMLGRFGISAVYAVITLHTAEMFPTQIRSSALGTSSTMAHVGSISAPYIVDFLGLIAWFIPTTICGSAVLLAGLLLLLLPETADRHLKDHVEEENHEADLHKQENGNSH